MKEDVYFKSDGKSIYSQKRAFSTHQGRVRMPFSVDEVADRGFGKLA